MNPLILNRAQLHSTSQFFGQSGAFRAFTKSDLTKLGMIAIFLTLVDSIQSYYGQKIINVFNEFNAIPGIYYNHGLLGYLLYAPIEFCVVFATMTVLWLWATYTIWYHKNVISRFFKKHSSLPSS